MSYLALSIIITTLKSISTFSSLKQPFYSVSQILWVRISGGVGVICLCSAMSGVSAGKASDDAVLDNS